MAQEDFRDKPSMYIGGFVGHSGSFLGSRDIRQGGGLAIAYEKPERRFRFGSFASKLVWEAYVDRTYSVNKDRSPNTKSGGILASARWFGKRDKAGQAGYFGAGWGLNYADRSSPDLDSRLNSTPMLEGGTTIAFGSQEFSIGVRYLHLSNAGMVGGNRGSNQLFLTVGFRF